MADDLAESIVRLRPLPGACAEHRPDRHWGGLRCLGWTAAPVRGRSLWLR